MQAYQHMDIHAIIRHLVFVLVICTTHQAWAVHDCSHDKELVFMYCMRSISISAPSYVTPSASCRGVVRSCDMTCVCSIITPTEQEKLIDVARLIHLAEDCGKPIPRGSKCGSKYQNSATFKIANSCTIISFMKWAIFKILYVNFVSQVLRFHMNYLGHRQGPRVHLPENMHRECFKNKCMLAMGLSHVFSHEDVF